MPEKSEKNGDSMKQPIFWVVEFQGKDRKYYPVCGSSGCYSKIHAENLAKFMAKKELRTRASRYRRVKS